MATVMGHSVRPDVAEQVAPILVASLEQDPSCARTPYTIGTASKSLMHWACALKCPLSVVQAIHEAWPEACRELHMYPRAARGCLPLHEALRVKDSNLAVIEYLVQQYPESARIPDNHGKFPLFWAVFHHPQQHRQQLFSLFAQRMEPGQVRQAISEGSVGWEHPEPFPLELLEMLIDIHEPASLVAKGTVGQFGVDFKVKGDSLVVAVPCDEAFDYCIDLLLQVSIPLKGIPLKGIETSTMDCSRAVNYFIATLAPDEEGFIADMDAMLSTIQLLGLEGNIPLPGMANPQMPHQFQAPAPLDLSTVERISIDSVIPNSETMVEVLASLEALPNLKILSMSGAQNRFEGIDVAFTRNCFQRLSTLSDRLVEIDLIYFDSSIVTALVQLIQCSSILTKVSLDSFHVLTADQVAQLAEALRGSTSIQSLKLKQKDAAERIVELIRQDSRPSLREFDDEDGAHYYKIVW